MADFLNSKDVEEASNLVKDVPTIISGVVETVQNLLKRIKNHELDTEKGLSLLELKNHTLLNYVMNLSYVLLQKMSGNSIEKDPAIERLAELRIVLEKIRPIDEKLKYQVNKLLSAATTGSVDIADPLRFRANPESLANQDDEMLDEDKKTSNVYVPPKISAAYYDEDNTLEGRRKKVLEHSQKRALSSSVLYELQKEYDTGPEEIKETVDPYRLKLNEEMKERNRYEEEYMLRLPMTKRQKHESRRLMTVGNFSSTVDDISALNMGSEATLQMTKSKAKRGKFSKYKGKKKGKKNW